MYRASEISSNISARFATVDVPFFDISHIVNDGNQDGKCSLGGGKGKFEMDLFISPWLKLGYNCTLKSFLNFGSIEKGTGLKGAMKRKEIDLSIFPTKIWDLNRFDYVGYFNPVYDEFLQIICSYNYTEHFEEEDLLDTYLEFHWSYYISLLLSIMFFIFIWNACSNVASRMSAKMKNEIRNARSPTYWTITRAILDQDQFPKISHIAFTIISLCISAFFFVTIDCFMMNLLRTELVIIEEPAVIRSYHDIIERPNIEMLFLTGSDEEGFFKDAKVGSIEAQIWKKRRSLDEFTIDSIADVWQPIIDQKIVAIVRDWLGNSAANLGLTKTREMGIKNIRAIVTKDERGNFFTNAFMYNKNAPEAMIEYGHERLYRISQSGILEWFMKERMPVIVGGSEIMLEKFVAPFLFLPEPPEPNIQIQNMYNLFILCLILIVIATIVLVYEISREKIRQKLIDQEIAIEEKFKKRRKLLEKKI